MVRMKSGLLPLRPDFIPKSSLCWLVEVSLTSHFCSDLRYCPHFNHIINLMTRSWAEYVVFQLQVVDISNKNHKLSVQGWIFTLNRRRLGSSETFVFAWGCRGDNSQKKQPETCITYNMYLSVNTRSNTSMWLHLVYSIKSSRYLSLRPPVRNPTLVWATMTVCAVIPAPNFLAFVI